MGVKIYWWLVAAVIALGVIMPQEGKKKKYYIIVVAALHIFVCGFRYKFLTGDLIKYEWNYRALRDFGWLSSRVLEGKNVGFTMFMKLLSGLSGGEFQVCLFAIAAITEIGLAVLIYRHSPKPWYSYLVWNCMGFYIFGFSAIKQALAMGILTWSMLCILEEKPRSFLFLTLLAGFIHAPALAFLPAYVIARQRINLRTLMLYAVAGALIFLFRNSVVTFVSSFYYEEGQIEIVDTNLGGRFFVILLMLLTGFALRGSQGGDFDKLFNIVVVAAVFQIFSGFDNVFTRLADYYLQFTVLFIPGIFFDSRHLSMSSSGAVAPPLNFNRRSRTLLAAMLMVVLIWWYWRTNLGITISYEVDNYLNFRFMWDVVN